MGIAAGMALLGYGIYRYISKSSKSARMELQKTLTGEELLRFNLEEDLRKLGTVMLNEQRLIPFDAFISIFQIIRTHSKIKLESQVDELKSARRSALTAE